MVIEISNEVKKFYFLLKGIMPPSNGVIEMGTAEIYNSYVDELASLLDKNMTDFILRLKLSESDYFMEGLRKRKMVRRGNFYPKFNSLISFLEGNFSLKDQGQEGGGFNFTQNVNQSNIQTQKVDLSVLISDLEKEVGPEKMSELEEIAKSDEKEEGKIKKMMGVLGGLGKEMGAEILSKLVLQTLGGGGV